MEPRRIFAKALAPLRRSGPRKINPKPNGRAVVVKHLIAQSCKIAIRVDLFVEMKFFWAVSSPQLHTRNRNMNENLLGEQLNGEMTPGFEKVIKRE